MTLIPAAAKSESRTTAVSIESRAITARLT
jgi:hypothetical protein